MALDIILYKFDKRLIGLQFLISEQSPFFGINFIEAARKFGVKTPLLKQQLANLNSGTRRKVQYFFMKALLKPSIPGADLTLHLFNELSSSSMVKGLSNDVLSVSVNLEFTTIGEDNISAPKNFSMLPK
jgi:hypothetical protein